MCTWGGVRSQHFLSSVRSVLASNAGHRAWCLYGVSQLIATAQSPYESEGGGGGGGGGGGQGKAVCMFQRVEHMHWTVQAACKVGNAYSTDEASSSASSGACIVVARSSKFTTMTCAAMFPLSIRHHHRRRLSVIMCACSNSLAFTACASMPILSHCKEHDSRHRYAAWFLKPAVSASFGHSGCSQGGTGAWPCCRTQDQLHCRGRCRGV